MTHAPTIFDRALLRKRRSRAAKTFASYNFLVQEAAQRVADRLDDMTRTFPLALDLGAHGGELAALAHPKIGTLVQSDISLAMLQHASGLRVACDEEYLPFAERSFDAVFNLLSLYSANDLPGCFVQARRALKDDGLFLAVLPGGDTLYELRECLAAAAIDIAGGVSAHVAPFLDVRDAGALLQRAGFALPVVDSERLSVSYTDMFALMTELQSMGANNLLHQRQRGLSSRRLFARAAEIYQERHSDDEGRIIATFEFITLTAWKPHASQQKPAQRGSGKISLVNALKE